MPLKKLTNRLAAGLKSNLWKLGRRLERMDSKLGHRLGFRRSLATAEGQLSFMRRLFKRHNLFSHERASFANGKRWMYEPARNEIEEALKKNLVGDVANYSDELYRVFRERPATGTIAQELVGLAKRMGYDNPEKAALDIVSLVHQRSQSLIVANDNLRGVYAAKKAKYTRKGRAPTATEKQELMVLENSVDCMGQFLSVFGARSTMAIEDLKGD